MTVFIGFTELDMMTCWNIDRTDTTSQTALLRPGQIDVTDLCAVDKFLDRVTAITLVFPKTQKDIVVSVKNALHFTFLAERLGKLTAQLKARPQ